jgi:Flp pilus assembly CpaE family ATPase
MGIETERIRLVANRYGQPRELPLAQAQSALGAKIENFVVNDPNRVQRSANEGKLVASPVTISRNLFGSVGQWQKSLKARERR